MNNMKHQHESSDRKDGFMVQSSKLLHTEELTLACMIKKKTVAKASNVNITDLFLAYAESTPKVFTVASTVNTHSFQLSALCVLK